MGHGGEPEMKEEPQSQGWEVTELHVRNMGAEDLRLAERLEVCFAQG